MKSLKHILMLFSFIMLLGISSSTVYAGTSGSNGNAGSYKGGGGGSGDRDYYMHKTRSYGQPY